MELNTKFVAFDVREMHDEDKLVNSLLDTSVKYLNDKVMNNPKPYGSMNGSDVEQLSFETMVSVAPSVGFPRKCIELVSGHIFPDIIFHGKHYGVEIKSTQKDQWTSTGSSIVESTRYQDVDRIFILFGKLGGIPEFKCKPYQMCMSNIAVTHSPRYLIDMNLSDQGNIFSKMDIQYDIFRELDDVKKISQVRDYYIKKAKAEHKHEMPWWMGETTNVNISFLEHQPLETKRIIKAKAFIFFFSIYKFTDKSRYNPISLWLCNSYSLLSSHIRDLFSAGGQCHTLNGRPLLKPYPRIVKNLVDSTDLIKAFLEKPDKDILMGIDDFWDFDYDRNDLFGSWLNKINESFKNEPSLQTINIVELISTRASLK